VVATTADGLLRTTWTVKEGLHAWPIAAADELPAGFAGSEAGACVAADWDGDGHTDLLRVFAAGALIHRGDTNGGFATPTVAIERALPGAPLSVEPADLDGDGRLDVALGTRMGPVFWRQTASGLFEEHTSGSGEAVYVSKPQACRVRSCDINMDGRQDLMVVYETMMPQFFFSRGFFCFGYANGLDVTGQGRGASDLVMKSAGPLGKGQQAGAIADVDGDGLEEAFLVDAAGAAWLLRMASERTRLLSLTVRAAPGKARPITVTAREGKRSLGARIVTPTRPAVFGLTQRGPVLLEWRGSDGSVRSNKGVVIHPQAIVLPGE
jgi:hypothetical protein